MYECKQMQLRHRFLIGSQHFGQDSFRLGFWNPQLLLDNPVVVPWEVRNRKGQILQRHGRNPAQRTALIENLCKWTVQGSWQKLHNLLIFCGLCFHDFHGVFTVKSRIFTLTNFINFWPSQAKYAKYAYHIWLNPVVNRISEKNHENKAVPALISWFDLSDQVQLLHGGATCTKSSFFRMAAWDEAARCEEAQRFHGSASGIGIYFYINLEKIRDHLPCVSLYWGPHPTTRGG